MKPIFLAVALMAASIQAHADVRDEIVKNLYENLLKLSHSQFVLYSDHAKTACLDKVWNEPKAMEICYISLDGEEAIGAISYLVSLGARWHSIWMREHCKPEVNGYSCTWKGLTLDFATEAR